ncbi:MAG: hypothetical protein ABI904_03400 [Chloroflexota bacterium]
MEENGKNKSGDPLYQLSIIQHKIANRNKPNFDSEEAYKSIVYGGLMGFFSLGVGCVLTFQSLSQLKDIHGLREAFLSICLGPFFTIAILLQGVLSISEMLVKGIVVLNQRRNWLKETSSVSNED